MRQQRHYQVIKHLLVTTLWFAVACSSTQEDVSVADEANTSADPHRGHGEMTGLGDGADSSTAPPEELDEIESLRGSVTPCAPALSLYADAECDTLNAGIMGFSPQFPLWSDGVTKKRFVYLPLGTIIDVSDPDRWVFPVGTRFWKHFETPSGVRLETRVIEKTSDQLGVEGWDFQTYIWNEAGNDVTPVTDGLENVLGTGHDIPAIEDCSECHSGGANQRNASLSQDELLDLALGFGAIQLNHEVSETTT